jgi:hypothetical protein
MKSSYGWAFDTLSYLPDCVNSANTEEINILIEHPPKCKVTFLILQMYLISEGIDLTYFFILILIQ